MEHTNYFEYEKSSRVKSPSACADVGGWSKFQTDLFLREQMKTEDSDCILLNDEINRQLRINQFINKYEQDGFKSVPVTQMRQIISLLLMEVYSHQYAPFVKKVKGIWKSPPKGWPSHIKYVDPNNRMKVSNVDECSRQEKLPKPKKDLLNPMLQHLVDEYLRMQRMSRPQQVEDFTEDEIQNAYNWNPHSELPSTVERLRTKFISVYQQKLIDESMFNRLLHIHGGLKLRTGETCTDTEFYAIQKLNMLLDVVGFRGRPMTNEEVAELNGIADSLLTRACFSPTSKVDAYAGIRKSRSPIIKQEAEDEDLMTALNIGSRGKPGSLLMMPVDDVVKRQNTCSNGTLAIPMSAPEHLAHMLNVDHRSPSSPLKSVSQPTDRPQVTAPMSKVTSTVSANITSKLNIATRVNSNADQMMTIDDFEVRDADVEEPIPVKGKCADTLPIDNFYPTDPTDFDVDLQDFGNGNSNLPELNADDVSDTLSSVEGLQSSVYDSSFTNSNYSSVNAAFTENKEDSSFEQRSMDMQSDNPMLHYNIADEHLSPIHAVTIAEFDQFSAFLLKPVTSSPAALQPAVSQLHAMQNPMSPAGVISSLEDMNITGHQQSVNSYNLGHRPSLPAQFSDSAFSIEMADMSTADGADNKHTAPPIPYFVEMYSDSDSF